MQDHDSVLDACATMADIRGRLIRDARQLMDDPHPAAEVPGDPESLFDLILELRYGDLKHLSRPVRLLSDLCRLLIRRGDAASFRRCLDLSHKIYSFKCERNESWHMSYLYKGIAQIGLGLSDMGITNVLFGLTTQKAYSLFPEDRCLALWALMSASVRHHNLKLAIQFAKSWRQAAADGGLASEGFRSRLVMYLFDLLLGHAERCREALPDLQAAAPAPWQETLALVSAWTDAMVSPEGRALSLSPSCPDPYPLFAGFPWYDPSLEIPEHGLSNFGFLCALRMRYPRMESLSRLPASDLELFATIVARWELPTPLEQIEEAMRKADALRFHQFSMSRFMGKYRSRSLIGSHATGDTVIRKPNAILLTMDIRRFSSLCEMYPCERIFEMINPVFRIMHGELERAGGTLVEFAGDCMIMAFNLFDDRVTGIVEVLQRTVRCMKQLRIQGAFSREQGLPALKAGVGIAMGDVAVGFLGGLSRCHLAIIGNAINLSTRLETETKKAPASIVVSAASFPGSWPDIWSRPEEVTFTLRDGGVRDIKNMRPTQVFAVRPLLDFRIDFVPMGLVVAGEPGVVYIDTGNSTSNGIIDHHLPGREAGSACELLVRHPGYLTDHLKDVPEHDIEFRLHEKPDLDCAATLYAAYELLSGADYIRRDSLQKLAAYVSRIDQGHIPEPEHLADSLYGAFIIHQQESLAAYRKTPPQPGIDAVDVDSLLLRAGLRVIDAAFFEMDAHPQTPLSRIFADHPGWFATERELIRTDRIAYAKDLLHAEAGRYPARIRQRVTGAKQTVTALWLHRPESRFFKLWVRTDPCDGDSPPCPVLAVNWSTPNKSRFVFSVEPESGWDLKGLGEALEEAESRKRRSLGKERPTQPRRYPSDNADPWYFGQGHAYTIVDSPREGTILSELEVREILASW